MNDISIASLRSIQKLALDYGGTAPHKPILETAQSRYRGTNVRFIKNGLAAIFEQLNVDLPADFFDGYASVKNKNLSSEVRTLISENANNILSLIDNYMKTPEFKTRYCDYAGSPLWSNPTHVKTYGLEDERAKRMDALEAIFERDKQRARDRNNQNTEVKREKRKHINEEKLLIRQQEKTRQAPTGKQVLELFLNADMSKKAFCNLVKMDIKEFEKYRVALEDVAPELLELVDKRLEQKTAEHYTLMTQCANRVASEIIARNPFNGKQRSENPYTAFEFGCTEYGTFDELVEFVEKTTTLDSKVRNTIRAFYEGNKLDFSPLDRSYINSVRIQIGERTITDDDKRVALDFVLNNMKKNRANFFGTLRHYAISDDLPKVTFDAEYNNQRLLKFEIIKEEFAKLNIAQKTKSQDPEIIF